MRERQVERLERALERLNARLSAPTRARRDRAKADQSVGRLRERYPRAASLYEIAVQETPDPAAPTKKRLSLRVARREGRDGWAGLTEVEDSFRIAKHDLDLRPIFHHKADRTQAHILVCFLALVLWRTLQHWMEASGLGTVPRNLLEEMAEVRSLDVVLPAGAEQSVRLRIVSRPELHLAILLERLHLPLPNRPKRVANVVAKIADEIEKTQQIETLSL